jgi:hypothetical protein
MKSGLSSPIPESFRGQKLFELRVSASVPAAGRWCSHRAEPVSDPALEKRDMSLRRAAVEDFNDADASSLALSYEQPGVLAGP